MNGFPRGIVIPAFVAAAALWAPDAAAQVRQDSALVGVVRDPSGAVLPDVQIRVSSVNLIGGARDTRTDADGRYRVTALPLGVYELSAVKPGFRTATVAGIDVPLAATVTLDLTMGLPGVAEEVTVAAAAVVAAGDAAVTTRIDRDLLTNLPLARGVFGLQNLAPGVTSNVGFGGAQFTNALVMDAVPVASPQTGGNATRVNINWVEEVQIMALGANAEAGEFTGAVTNAVLRSGSNQFSGLADYYTTRGGWVSDNTSGLEAPLRATFAPRQVDENWDLSLQAGGPVLRDRLWFFAGFQQTQRGDRPAGVTDGFTRASLSNGIGKLTWAPAAAVRMEGMVSPNAFEATHLGLSPTMPLEATWRVDGPGVQWSTRLTWTLSPRTLLDVRAGGFRSREDLLPMTPGGREGPPPTLELTTGVVTDNAIIYSTTRDRSVASGATLTRFAEGFAGSHELKFGVELERSAVRSESGYPGGLLYQSYQGVPYYATIWDGYLTQPRNARTSAFVQDTWQPTPRLVIDPGLRVSTYRGSVPGAGTVFSTNPISPRIGAAWDVLGDHRLVLRTHWGRYHDPLVSFFYDFKDTAGQSPVITALVLGPGEFLPIDERNPAAYDIDPGVRQSHVDQWILGAERELFGAASLQLQYIRRRFKDFLGFVSDAQYELVQRLDPGPDGRPRTADDAGFVSVYNLTEPGTLRVTNPPGAHREYDGLQLVFRKPLARQWQLLGSYTWSRTRGNATNRASGNTPRGTDLGVDGVFANPNAAINADGPASFDPTHQVKVEGTWHPAWLGGFTAGVVYRYTTGAPWSRTIGVTGLRQGFQLVRVEPRGAQRLDPMNTLDLRFGKRVSLGDSRGRFDLYLDVFNLTNQGTHDSGNAAVPIRERSGPTFGQPFRWVEPRTLRAGVRLTFGR